MRIIRILMVLGILSVVLMPQIVKAADAEASNETKINFEIADNIKIENGIVKNNSETILKTDIDPFSSEEGKKRAAVLAKHQDKIAKANFPKGKFIINATAYTAAADECGKSDGITASGLKVKENETIACPSPFPFGTKIYIEGLGTRVCEDRGGAIKGNHIDVYMETKAEAFQFGRRMLEAEVII